MSFRNFVATRYSRVMTEHFDCPHLGGRVDLTDERLEHIKAEHQDLEPFINRIGDVLRDPDEVRQSTRDEQIRLFARWYDDVKRGKHVIVVVVSEPSPSQRHWIITAYMAQRLTGGIVEWVKN